MKKQLIITILCFGIVLWGGLFAAESKALAATLTVTKTADTNDNVCDADCSLREAIAAANPAGGDVIVFAAPLFDSPQTITLVHGELFNDGKSFFIDGPGANKLTVSANQASRVLRVYFNGGGTVLLKGMTIADGVWNGDGNDNGGAGIFKHGSGGTLGIESCAVSRNHAGGIAGYGGGLASFSEGIINIHNSTFDNNSATFGGGMFINNGQWVILNSTISGNTATDNGGGISFGDGDWGGSNSNYGYPRIIYNSTIAFNTTNPVNFGGISGNSDRNILRNSIVAANVGALDAYETGFEENYRHLSLGNVIQSGFYPYLYEDGIEIPNIYNQDARLAPLDYYGGTTRTHALLQDSPAHEAADECIVGLSWQRCFELAETTVNSYQFPITSQIDQRGQPRLIINPDSGAFEENIKFERSHLPYGIGGAAYSQAITVKRMINAIGDEASVPNAVFSVTPLAGEQLPPGLSLSPAGVLSGTPTALGSFTFTVKLLDPDTDTGGAARYTVVIRSTPPPPMIVTKTADTNDGVCDADCSLREAINNVFPGEAIGFSSLFDTTQTITLALGELVVSKPLVINGKGASLTTVSGNDQSRVFRLTITADLTINDLTITGGRGGAIPERYEGELGRGGGGIYNVSGRLTINRSRVVNNLATSPQPTEIILERLKGGGILNYRGARLLLSDSTVSGNISSPWRTYGVGIYNERAKATITNSIISDNTTSMPNNPTNYGAGINSTSGALDITGTTITGNNLHYYHFNNGYGAGAYISHGTAAIKSSTISHNNWLIKSGQGGGIAFIASKAIITGSTITDNIASDGGGIFIFPSETTLYSVNPFISIRNTIISGNKRRNGFNSPLVPDDVGGLPIPFTLDDHNYIGGDARLAPLGNYGGATPTHALLPDSPAINAGNNCVLDLSCSTINTFSPLTTDQRGVGRIIGEAVDIGAFEFDDPVVEEETADLSVSKDDGVTSVTAGEQVIYTIVVSNAGPDAANGATVSDILPPELTGAVWSCTGSGGGTCMSSGSGNIDETVDLPVGASVTFTVTANVSSSASGTLSNTATVSAPDGTTDPNSENNSANDSDEIEIFCVNNPVVANTNDSGAGSLRQAVIDACPGSTITFASNVKGQIILTTGELTIDKNLTIHASGTESIAVSGGGASRVFYIASGANVSIIGLNVTGGNGSGTTSSSGCGGGILVEGGILNLTNSTVSNNSAAQHGGGIANINGTLNLTNSTVSNNSTTVSGGGISNFDTLNLTNSTVSENAAPNGGGIYNEGAVNLKSTIIANSSSGGDCVSTGIIDASYSLIEAGLECVNGATNSTNLSGDPKLGPLRNNGGTSLTHRLLPGSPVLDKGNSFGSNKDQRGFPRPVDIASIADADGGDGSDIGAYEAGRLPRRTPLDFDGDGKTDAAVVLFADSMPERGDVREVRELRNDGGKKSNDLLIDGSFSPWKSEYRRYLDFRTGRGTVPLTKDVAEIVSDIEKQQSAGEFTDVNVKALVWMIEKSSDGTFLTYELGTENDRFIPGDYDGDGKCDAAVWSPDLAQFTIIYSSDLTTHTFALGSSASDPSVVGDYDGDGADDPAVYEPATGEWSWLGGAEHDQLQTQIWQPNSKPAPGDYDGDGLYDFAVQKPHQSNPHYADFLIAFNDGSVSAPDLTVYFGSPSIAFAPGDYDGDGKTDIAYANYYAPAAPQIVWRILTSSSNYRNQIKTFFGIIHTDLTTQGDYDGDGKTDLSVYRKQDPENGDGHFRILRSSDQTTMLIDLGGIDDYPVAFFNTH